MLAVELDAFRQWRHASMDLSRDGWCITGLDVVASAEWLLGAIRSGRHGWVAYASSAVVRVAVDRLEARGAKRRPGLCVLP